MKFLPPKVQVFVVNGSPIGRYGLAQFVGTLKDYCICGEAGRAPEARRLCQDCKPDLIVLELPLRGAIGITLIREFSRLARTSRTVVICEQVNEEMLRRFFQSGAYGCVRREDELDELRRAFESVAGGKRFVSAAIEQALLGGLAGRSILQKKAGTKGDSGVERLSTTETAVFELIGRGLRPLAIAQEMGISVKTVESHQDRIKQKLGVRSAAEVRERAGRCRIAGLLEGTSL